MQSHTTVGAEILQKVAKTHDVTHGIVQMAIGITRHHHERYDGKGYPDRLSGDGIPLAARMLAIADVYDALRSRRTYKPSVPHLTVVEWMTEGSAGQFDPHLLRVFSRCAARFDQIFMDHPG